MHLFGLYSKIPKEHHLKISYRFANVHSAFANDFSDASLNSAGWIRRTECAKTAVETAGKEALGALAVSTAYGHAIGATAWALAFGCKDD